MEGRVGTMEVLLPRASLRERLSAVRCSPAEQMQWHGNGRDVISSVNHLRLTMAHVLVESGQSGLREPLRRGVDEDTAPRAPAPSCRTVADTHRHTQTHTPGTSRQHDDGMVRRLRCCTMGLQLVLVTVVRQVRMDSTASGHGDLQWVFRHCPLYLRREWHRPSQCCETLRCV